MKRVYSSINLAEARMMANHLEQNQISVRVDDKPFNMAMGEIPFVECYIGVWVSDEDEKKAMDLVNRFFDANQEEETWKCPDCGEELEKQFTDCWNCGFERKD